MRSAKWKYVEVNWVMGRPSWQSDGLVPQRTKVRIPSGAQFFRVKKVMLARCRCAQPPCVYARTRMVLYWIAMMKSVTMIIIIIIIILLLLIIIIVLIGIFITIFPKQSIDQSINVMTMLAFVYLQGSVARTSHFPQNDASWVEKIGQQLPATGTALPSTTGGASTNNSSNSNSNNNSSNINSSNSNISNNSSNNVNNNNNSQLPFQFLTNLLLFLT